MANTLILNQNQVFNGLGTLTFTCPSTQAYNVQVQVTFPEALPINDDIALASPGIGDSLLPGQKVMGAGSGAGLGAGTGGGGEGFTGGDLGTGHGGVGQGFGAGNSYQQPPAAGSNVTANPYVASSLSIVVNNNGSAQYTSTTPTQTQSALQFRTSFLANANDTITVVLTGNATSDAALNGLTSNVSVGQGL